MKQKPNKLLPKDSEWKGDITFANGRYWIRDYTTELYCFIDITEQIEVFKKEAYAKALSDIESLFGDFDNDETLRQVSEISGKQWKEYFIDKLGLMKQKPRDEKEIVKELFTEFDKIIVLREDLVIPAYLKLKEKYKEKQKWSEKI